MNSWWCDFFDEELAELILGQLRPGELEFLNEHLKLKANSTVFDQCCGWGRVAGPLSERVQMVQGVDASTHMVESGRKRWNQVEFALGDAAEHILESLFDAAVNLYSSFGYTNSDAYNFRLLERLVASVKPGGRVILDTINPHRVYDDFRHEMVTKTLSGRTITRRSDLRKNDSLLFQDWEFEGADGVIRERCGVTKLYRAETLREWLVKTKCQPLYALGDLAGRPYARDSERLIWVGQV